MPRSGERGEPWFTALFAEHFGKVVRYAYRRVFDANLANDLAQEAFVIAWRRRHDVPDQELPWLYGVTRNVIANHRRAGLAAPATVAATDSDPGPRAEGFEEITAEMFDVLRAIAALPEPDQEILRLVAWEDLDLKEAAVVLGCSRSAAAVRLHRARKRLQAVMSGPGDRTVSMAFGEVRHV